MGGIYVQSIIYLTMDLSEQCCMESVVVVNNAPPTKGILTYDDSIISKSLNAKKTGPADENITPALGQTKQM